MPLLDHFHEPLWPSRDWHSFLSAWTTLIASDFNRQLPKVHFAEGNIEFNAESPADAVQVLIYDGSPAPALVGVALQQGEMVVANRRLRILRVLGD